MKVNRITAIGEILFDIYPDKKRLGGAPFNFLYHIWKITGHANFISGVGDDENGKEILGYLNSAGFNTKYILIDKEHPTGTVRVTLREDKIPQFIMSEENSGDFIKLNDSIEQLVKNETELLYFGTFSQRKAVTRSTINSLLGKRIKYFCDLNLRHNFYTKEIIETALIASNVVKVNEDELNIISNEIYEPGLEPNIIIHKLIQDFAINLLCVTKGAEGATLITKNEVDAYKFNVTNPVDTLGAGDAYAAILCLGYLKNLPIKEINILANRFAADICMVYGAIPADDSIYTEYRKIFS
jgi:fructokinase